MQDLVFDVIIGILILGMVIFAVGLFDTNLRIISSSTASKDTEITQIKEYQVSIADDVYTGADIVGYINEAKIVDNTVPTITIKDSSTIHLIDNVGREEDIKDASKYLKDNSYLQSEYYFDKKSYTFTKKKVVT